MRDRFRPLGWAAYGVGLLLILIPLLDSVLGVWPLRAGDVAWRFGAVGLFSRTIMTPLLGMLLTMLVALQMGHRLTTRIIAGICIACALVALATAGLFSLDALQTRVRVRPEATGAFNAATIVALAKYVAGAVVWVLMGVGGWKAAARIGEPSSGRVRVKGEAPPERGVLVGTGGAGQRR